MRQKFLILSFLVTTCLAGLVSVAKAQSPPPTGVNYNVIVCDAATARAWDVPRIPSAATYQWYVNGSTYTGMGGSGAFTPLATQATLNASHSALRTSLLPPPDQYAPLYLSCVQLDGLNQVVDTYTILIQLETPTVLIDINTADTVCPGTLVTFTAGVQTYVGGVNYQWSIVSGGGGSGVVGYGPTLTMPITNSTQVQVEITTAGGCTTKVNKTVNVAKDSLHASISTDKTDPVCPGESVTFTANSDALTAASYTWKNMAGTVLGYGQTLTQTITGTTTVRVSVVAANGCTSEPAVIEKTITVSNSGLNATVSANTADVVCPGESVTFTATTDAFTPVSYRWSSDQAGTADTLGYGQTLTQTILTAGKTVWVHILSANGCTAAASKRITTANNSLHASISVNTANTVCPGESVTFTAATDALTPVSYRWSSDQAGTADTLGYGQTLTQTILTAGKTVWVHILSANGCTATAEKTISAANNALDAIITYNSAATVCAGESVTFTATTNALTPVSYTWSDASASILGYGSTLTQTIPNGGATINVSIASLSGCSATDQVIISTIVIPQVVIPTLTVDGDLKCAGVPFVLTAGTGSGNNADTIYTFYRDGVQIGSGVSNIFSDMPTLPSSLSAYNYVYGVTMSVNTACGVVTTAMATQTVTVKEVPFIGYTTNSNSTVCEGSVVSITALPSDTLSPTTVITYNWYVNNDFTTVLGTGKTFSTGNLVAGSYTFTAKALFEIGTNTVCEAFSVPTPLEVEDSVFVSINKNVADTVCAGTTATFTANLGGGYNPSIVTLLWTSGTDTLGYGNVYNTVIINDLTLKVTATTTGGCVNEAADSVKLLKDTVKYTTLTANKTALCEGASVQLSVNVSNARGDEIYNWYRNGVLISSGATNSYIDMPTAGSVAITYTYGVTVSRPSVPCSVNSGLKTVNVTVYPQISVALLSTAPSYCVTGGSVTLTATVTDAAITTYTYSWFKDNATLAGNTATQNISAGTARTQPYSYHVVVSSPISGCTAVSNSVDIVVKSVPTAVATVDKTAVCEGGTFSFTANVSPAGTYNYQWHEGGTILSYQPTFDISTLPTGTHNIYVAIIPLNPDVMCSTQSTPVAVTVYADPTIALTANTTDMCVGGDIQITSVVTLNAAVANANNYQYQWTKNGVLQSGSAQDFYYEISSATGTYDYRMRLIQNDALGCQSAWSAPVSINVVAQPIVHIYRSDPQSHLDVCAGGNIDLEAVITNNNTVYGATPVFNWFESGVNTGTSGTPSTFTLSTVGKQYHYTATVSVTGYGCLTTTSDEVVVNVNNQPTWTDVHALTDDQNGHVCMGERIYLTAGVQGGVMDAVNNPNGIIQWYVENSAGVRKAVDGGVGASSWDDPDTADLYNYIVTYTGLIGSGCILQEDTAFALVNGYTLEVHTLPQAQFTSGDSSVICFNNALNVSIALDIALTGTPPFSFDIENLTTGATIHYGPIFQNTYTVYVSPSVTSVYRIANLKDAYCAASTQLDVSLTVFVSHIEVPDFFTTECNEDSVTTYHTVFLPINIISGNPLSYTATFVDPAYSAFDFTSNIVNKYPWGTSIEIHLPLTAGDYEIEIDIEGCKYATIGRVLVDEYALGGASLIVQRWDDVLTVNNNWNNNSGLYFYSFQWYKDGKIIPGATKQYYVEPSGNLNGSYHVVVNGYAILANGDTIAISYVSCPFVPAPTFKMNVYPTPAATNQNIIFETDMSQEQLENAVLNIYDVKGALIKTVTNLRSQTTISGFPVAGMYFGHLITEKNETKYVKFVITQ